MDGFYRNAARTFSVTPAVVQMAKCASSPRCSNVRERRIDPRQWPPPPSGSVRSDLHNARREPSFQPDILIPAGIETRLRDLDRGGYLRSASATPTNARPAGVKPPPWSVAQRHRHLTQPQPAGTPEIRAARVCEADRLGRAARTGEHRREPAGRPGSAYRCLVVRGKRRAIGPILSGFGQHLLHLNTERPAWADIHRRHARMEPPATRRGERTPPRRRADTRADTSPGAPRLGRRR